MERGRTCRPSTRRLSIRIRYHKCNLHVWQTEAMTPVMESRLQRSTSRCDRYHYCRRSVVEAFPMTSTLVAVLFSLILLQIVSNTGNVYIYVACVYIYYSLYLSTKVYLGQICMSVYFLHLIFIPTYMGETMN